MLWYIAGMTLGRLLRKRREALSLTLDEVSAKTGYSKPYLSTVETGKVKNPPSEKLLRKLERILGFEPGELVHMAQLQRMPRDIRKEYETIGAQNRQYRRIIRQMSAPGQAASAIGDMIAAEELDTESAGARIEQGRLVPILNKVSAGYPQAFDDMGHPVGYADDYVRCPDVNDENAFALRVVGDSMEPRFMEGNIVVFSPNTPVKNGDDCLVRFDEPHETAFKQVYFDPDVNQPKTITLKPRNPRYPPQSIDPHRITGIYRAIFKFERL